MWSCKHVLISMTMGLALSAHANVFAASVEYAALGGVSVPAASAMSFASQGQPISLTDPRLRELFPSAILLPVSMPVNIPAFVSPILRPLTTEQLEIVRADGTETVFDERFGLLFFDLSPNDPIVFSGRELSADTFAAAFGGIVIGPSTPVFIGANLIPRPPRTQPIPEPTSVALFGLGAACIYLRSSRAKVRHPIG